MRWVIIAAFSLIVVVHGFGGLAAAGHSSPATVPSRDLALGIRTVTVTITERRCSLSQMTVPQGTLVFRLVNRGRRAHVFTVARKRSAPVGAGKTGVLRVAFSAPGSYRYACASLGTRRGTIVGVLTVVAAMPSPSRPCGTSSAPPAAYEHVVWIVMENRNYRRIIGSTDAPYINQLARKCGLATNFHAESHPSLPNYIALTSGDTQGIRDDAGPSSHPLQVPSVFSQLGTGWRALQESMPGNCSLFNSGRYAVKHNPAAYYVSIRAQCQRQDVPLTDPPQLSARFTLITPDLCSDMHDCSTADGDRWLATWLSRILGSAEYKSGSTAVFLTWDEDGDNHIATLVMSPSTPPGTMSNDRFDHYSLLRTTEELLRIGSYLAQAASAPSMRAAFHL